MRSMVFRIICLIISLTVVHVPMIAAAQSAIMAPYSQPPLVWESVTDWHADPESRIAPPQTMKSQVTLSAGQGLWFLSDSGTYIRVETDNDQENLKIWQGGAMGLFRRLPMIRGAGGTLISQTPLERRAFIWVSNQGQASVKIHLQRGSHQAVPFVSNWPFANITGMETHWLRQYPKTALQGYARIENKPQMFSAYGPALLAIDVRRSRLESPPERRDTLTIQLDQSEPQEHLLHFAPQRALRHFWHGEDVLLSKPERVFVPVPEGEHEIRLQSTAPAWIQVRQLATRRHLASESDWNTSADDSALFLQHLYAQHQFRLKQLVTGGADPSLALAAGATPLGEPSATNDLGTQVLFDRYTQSRPLWPARPLAEKRWQPVTATLESPESERDVVDAEQTYLPGHHSFFRIEAKTTPIAFHAPTTTSPTQLTLRLAQAAPGTRLTLNIRDQHYSLIYEPRISASAQTRPVLAQRQSVERQLLTNPVLAAETRLVLPAGVEHITLAADQGAGWFNLQMREPIDPAMTEAEFLNALTDQGKHGLARAWRAKARPKKLPLQVWKDAEFLRNWLRARAADFTRTVSPQLHVEPSPQKAAERLSTLINSRNLELAQNYARGLLAFGTVSSEANGNIANVRRTAYEFLADQFENRASTFAKQTLLAFEYLDTGNDAIALELSEQLLAEGLAEQALKLAYTIPQTSLNGAEKEQYQRLMIRSALISKWNRTFQTFAQALPEWRQLYTGNRQWREWPLAYDNPVQRETLFNPQLNRHYQRLKVTSAQPVALSIKGPAKLRISLNLLHAKRSSRLDDMIEVTHNGKTYRLPFLDSAVYNTHRLLSDDALWPGNLMPVLLELGPGNHRLSLRPTDHPILAHWEIAVPELAPSHPVLQQHMDPAQCAKDRRQFQTEVEQRLGGETGTVTTLPLQYTPASWQLEKERALLLEPLDCPIESQKSTHHSSAGELLSIEPAPIAENNGRGYSSATSVAQRLSVILDTENFSSRPALVAEANWLGHGYPEDERIQSLLARINEQQAWAQEEIIISSAGFQRFDSTGWAPESDFLEARSELLGVRQQTDEFLVFGQASEGIIVNNSEPQRYSLRLRLAKPGYQIAPPTSLQLLVDGELSRRVTLSQEEPVATINFSIAEGQHRISLRLSNPTSRHWVLARLRFRPDNNDNLNWKTAVPENRRYYHRVTRETPFTAYIDQPSWLRIETYDGREWQTRFRYQAQKGEITLRRADLQGPYVRLFSLRHQPGRKALSRIEMTPELTVTEPVNSYELTSTPSFALLADRLAPRPEDAGTHGGFASLQRRPDFETTGGEREQFFETGYRYRYLQENANVFWQSEVFGRAHDSDRIGVLGGRQWISWHPDRRNWRAGFYANGLWQFSGTDDQQAGSLLVEGRLDGRMPLGATFLWQHDVEGFARWLSENDGEGQAWDNDVFSRYKDDHRYGINWEESLIYQPYEDARSSISIGLRTNEDLNPFRPDRFLARLGWQQYFTGTRFEVSLENRWLQADRDRQSARTQTLLDLSATWHGWQAAGKRWEFRAGLGYDLDDEQMSASLSVSLDLPGARRLRDFRPEQFVFKRRQHVRAANQVDNNLLNYVEEE
ncbi:hypothetical protein [Cycloclasticus pugetii]|uniref:hypothetical protein n=1 Tax=Cycloclasticus pugetii TaxID=34068 RepID=UPI003A8F47B3